jgi:hypothetical protein
VWRWATNIRPTQKSVFHARVDMRFHEIERRIESVEELDALFESIRQEMGGVDEASYVRGRCVRAAASYVWCGVCAHV